MAEISGNELDYTIPQQYGAFLGGGNLLATQSLGTFSSGGLSSIGGFGDAAEGQYTTTTASYESYGTSGGAAELGGAQVFGDYSSYGGAATGGAAAFESSYSSATYGAEGASADFAGSFGGVAGSFGGVAGSFGGAAGAIEGGVALSEGSAEFSGAAGGMLPLNAYKIQVDQNPTIVRRQLAGAATVQRQNIVVRYLRPPAPPAPGPLIIKEIRPPQPRPAPPLVIKQRPPRPPTPPPLVLRERPPRMPVVVKTQTVVKRLAALPAPPRQVIIERYPALPAKPRDVIIERWLQYGPMPKRKVIVQRAAAARAYRTAKNLIIQYTAPRPSVQRIFRRLDVVAMSPSAYITQYGAHLLDSQSIVSAARAAGVVENISPPALVYATGAGIAGFGGSFAASEQQMITGGTFEAGLESSGYEGAAIGGGAVIGGGGAVIGGGGVEMTSTYSSYGTTAATEGFGAEIGATGGYSTVSAEYETGVEQDFTTEGQEMSAVTTEESYEQTSTTLN